jgi:hypothetical protein
MTSSALAHWMQVRKKNAYVPDCYIVWPIAWLVGRKMPCGVPTVAMI